MSLKIYNITKKIKNQVVIDGISFEVLPGGITGFLGPNGAGKSTTMKMITGYLSPNSGNIKVCNYDTKLQSIKAKFSIGYLPENNPLYLDLYVKEHLTFSGNFFINNRKQLKEKVREMIALCGLEREQHKKVGSLSKGYRQRVGLAQALLHDPEILILDEPTTGLDPNQIIEIRNLIKTLSKDKTVLLSTHIMQEVESICKKAIVIDKGKIVANTNIDQLLTQSDQVVLTLEFKEKIDIAKLKDLIGIKSIEETGSDIKVVASVDSKQLREKIFKFAFKNNYTLLQLKEEKSNIEQVFRQLTQDLNT